ncbi:hypothetical protein GCM10009760_41300 [Kitasatospora kazusensis]|uniref:Uncharacterized protein n=1 Tax=Kitasatospora kazusensis TaxID=407974 RepID=A0ABN2ZW90_9ACTN
MRLAQDGQVLLVRVEEAEAGVQAHHGVERALREALRSRMSACTKEAWCPAAGPQRLNLRNTTGTVDL